MKAVAVEQWLYSLKFEPATKAKIWNIIFAIVTHRRRYGMILNNLIMGVRYSAKRLKEPDVLTPEEFQCLLAELHLREKVMVMLSGRLV